MPSDAPPGFFICPRHPGALTISPGTCACLYRRSKRAQPWDSSVVCRGCPIGAEHAGEIVVPEPANCCCWCGAKLGQTRRLVLAGTICVSCANRLYEVARARYRRRGPTGIARELHVFAIQIEEPANDPDPGSPDT